VYILFSVTLRGVYKMAVTLQCCLIQCVDTAVCHTKGWLQDGCSCFLI